MVIKLASHTHLKLISDELNYKNEMIRNDVNYHARRKMNENDPTGYSIQVPEKAELGENYCLFRDTTVIIKLNKTASQSEMK
jgi:hypothetical protein